MRADPHIDINIWQQLQFIVVYGAKQFADAARPAWHDLLWNHLGLSVPGAVRKSVPCDAYRLIWFKTAKLRFVHKRPHTNLVQIRHFRQKITNLDEITLPHRQRIQSSVSWRRYFSVAHF